MQWEEFGQGWRFGREGEGGRREIIREGIHRKQVDDPNRGDSSHGPATHSVGAQHDTGWETASQPRSGCAHDSNI